MTTQTQPVPLPAECAAGRAARQPVGGRPLEAISAEVELPAPPDAPGVFRCAAPDPIGQVFRHARMHEVAETDGHGFFEPASAHPHRGRSSR